MGIFFSFFGNDVPFFSLNFFSLLLFCSFFSPQKAVPSGTSISVNSPFVYGHYGDQYDEHGFHIDMRGEGKQKGEREGVAEGREKRE